MRILDWNEPEHYKPLDRGIAFVQYYENGDKYDCHSNAFDWSYDFWFRCLSGGLGRRDTTENLMGGEL